MSRHSFAVVYRGLCVAVLARHGEVQPEGVAVDNIHIARLRPATARVQRPDF